MQLSAPMIYAGAFVLFLLLGTWAWFIAERLRTRGSQVSTVLAGISSEMFAAVITTLMLGLIFWSIQTNEIRSELIFEMGSPTNSIATEATRKLRSRGWLEDGTLQGAYLQDADLSEADLSGADLRGVNLRNADLTQTDLSGANLDGADLSEATLRGTILQDTQMESVQLYGATLDDVSLQNANIRGALLHRHEVFDEVTLDSNVFLRTDLTDVDLHGLNLLGIRLDSATLCNTNLRGATLVNTNLENEDLVNAIVDETTRLPDGTMWSPEDFEMIAGECP